ncbi:hypothetical protein [Paenarthrobacter sp. NPDC057981]|uniref:hypothetical protein n=1 Tax=Paenarthrobacter sp. NPDC057981 TaxID=3346297 RepID=UPI0036DF3C25
MSRATPVLRCRDASGRQSGRAGQSKFAHELRDLVSELREHAGNAARGAAIVPFAHLKGEPGALINVSCLEARLGDLALTDKPAERLRASFWSSAEAGMSSHPAVDRSRAGQRTADVADQSFGVMTIFTTPNGSELDLHGLSALAAADKSMTDYLHA